MGVDFGVELIKNMFFPWCFILSLQIVGSSYITTTLFDGNRSMKLIEICLMKWRCALICSLTYYYVTVGIFSLKWYGNDRKINCLLDWFQYLYLVNYYWAAKNPYSKYQLMLKKWYKILIFSWILCLSLPGKPELAKFGKIRLATSTRRSIEVR